MLEIYHASAGSGKTYTLVKFFIKLAFENIENVQHTLVITFTNKATQEIKDRIINDLYELSTTTKKQLAKDLMDECNYSFHDIRDKAWKTLEYILHNYDYFNVKTIDSFLQTLIKSLTHEVGINYGNSLELHIHVVKNYIVNDILAKTNNDKQLIKCLCRCIDYKLNSEQPTDIRNIIDSFTENIFKEPICNQNVTLPSMSELTTLWNKLYNQQIDFEKTVKQRANKIIELIESHKYNLSNFAYGDKGIVGNIYKIAKSNEYQLNQRILEKYDNVDAWITKKNKDKSKSIFINDHVIPLTRQLVDYYRDNITHYNTNKTISKMFHIYGIVNRLSDSLRTYRTENNLLLIQDVANMLSKIIQDDDVHFIFEKVGVKLEYFFIDEFQDVSDTQWQIIKPLIKNAIAQGKTNIIVGDSKQSIYRWRGSNNNLLYRIPDDIRSTIHHLQNNWRSIKDIVQFNNDFFCKSNEIIKQFLESRISNDSKITEALNNISKPYNDVKQLCPGNSRQHEGNNVMIEFVNNDNEALQKTLLILKQLESENKSKKDTVIIVRDNKEGEQIITFVNNNSDIKISSDTTLKLSNNISIQLIIDILKYLKNGKNDDILKFEIKMLHSRISDNKNTNIIDRIDTIDTFCNLYKTVNNVIKALGDIKCCKEYINCFLDVVFEYQITYHSDSNFLQWWELSKDDFKVQKSNDNVIRVMTIHQSKGLEFKNVIIPFCNWSLDHVNNPVIWCKHQNNIFPVMYSEPLNETEFKNEYMIERIKTYYDNLNLLYVAFTRSIEKLFIIGQNTNKISSGKVKNLNTSTILISYYNNSVKYNM